MFLSVLFLSAFQMHFIFFWYEFIILPFHMDFITTKRGESALCFEGYIYSCMSPVQSWHRQAVLEVQKQTVHWQYCDKGICNNSLRYTILQQYLNVCSKYVIPVNSELWVSRYFYSGFLRSMNDLYGPVS